MTDFSQFKYIDTIPTSSKIKRLCWEFTWLFFFRPTPRWAMHGWRIFLLKIFGAKIGRNSRISPSCKIWAPWNLEIGDYTVLGDKVECYTMAPIKLGSKVAVSQGTFLCAGTHQTNSLLRPLITASIVVGDHVWIAAESFVHPGIEIGEGTVVGARSVVNKNLPSWAICTGNPCKYIKPRTIIPPKGTP